MLLRHEWAITAALGLVVALPAMGQADTASAAEENKRIARAFYEDLWFTNNTDKYDQYVADTYVVHDIGDRKGVAEPAIEQKHIADFFWANAELSGEIDYQIAEGDLVATRWRGSMKPTTLLGRAMLSEGDLPIINVFRFENGKIVEIWNHRHDIDIPGRRLAFRAQGFAVGLVPALAVLVYAWTVRRRLKRVRVSPA
jgi:predicted SnoaL-like aldol condensation-catalyzing enzyme